MSEIVYLGIDLGTSRTSITSSTGIRTTVWSYVGYPKDHVAKKKMGGREIIYGKEKESDGQAILGAPLFHRIKGRVRVEGGMGHSLYEIYRVAPAGAIGREAAQASKLYYAYLRQPYPHQLQEVLKALSSMKSKEPSKFRH